MQTPVGLRHFDAGVRESEAGRRLVHDALRAGGHYPWDWQPIHVASGLHVRDHVNPDTLENIVRAPKGNGAGAGRGVGARHEADGRGDRDAVGRDAGDRG